VAAKFGLEPDRLIFGCGSDEVFSLLCQVYLEPGDNMVQGEYGFMAYRIAARAAGGEVRFAPEPNLRLDVDQLLAQVDDQTKLVFLANPANPTGAWLTDEEVRRLHAGLPAHTILVLDGAYAEFADDPRFNDGLDLARGAENVVVTHTFSKIHGLAALRVGWGYAPAAIVDALERIRLPFNLSIPGQEAAIAALQDDAFLERSRALVNTWRPWLAQQIGGLGLEVLPSQANFVTVLFPETPGRTAHDAEAFLASRGYIVRGLASYNLGEALRITIGLEEQNRAVVDLLAEFLGQAR
jgi:histidinol-phosphate aminotransferase